MPVRRSLFGGMTPEGKKEFSAEVRLMVKAQQDIFFARFKPSDGATFSSDKNDAMGSADENSVTVLSSLAASADEYSVDEAANEEIVQTVNNFETDTEFTLAVSSVTELDNEASQAIMMLKKQNGYETDTAINALISKKLKLDCELLENNFYYVDDEQPDYDDDASAPSSPRGEKRSIVDDYDDTYAPLAKRTLYFDDEQLVDIVVKHEDVSTMGNYNLDFTDSN